MTQKTIQKKNFLVFILIILILVSFVSAVESDFYTDSNTGKPLGSDTPATTTAPATTPPTITVPTTTTSDNYLEWIKQNAKGIEYKEISKDKGGGAEVTFQNPGGELKLKKPDGSGEYLVKDIVPEKEGKKAKVTLNADGTIKEAQLTVTKDSKAPLYLYVDNTKFEVPQGASVDYNKEGKKADVILRGGKLSEMPQQIDSKKKDDLKTNYKAEETTELPNGVILQKAKKGFPVSAITSINGKDQVSIGNAARFNGATILNYEYTDKKVNRDVEILGLRDSVSANDLTSAKAATKNYVMIDAKKGILEMGAASKTLLLSGKTGPIIVLDKENSFVPGMLDESVFAFQARNGGIGQIINQGDNKPAIINTKGEFIALSGPKHTYGYTEEGGKAKITLNIITGIPGLNLDSNDKYSAPFIMNNYDSNGKEVIKGHEIVMNSNNGFAVVPIGTEQAQLSNRDVWRSSLSSRVTPEGVQETPADLPLPVPPSTNPNIPIPENPAGGKPGDSCIPSTPGCEGGKCGPGGCGGKTIPSLNPGYTLPVDPTTQPNLPKEKVIDNMMSSSVRIHVQDSPDSRSGGSGTIIGDDGKGNAIIATCAHTFRDSGYRGAITMDTFNPQQSGSAQGVLSKAGIPARLIDYDAASDMALVSVPKDQLGNYQSARVAPQNFRVAPQESVYSAGCSKGADCTIANQKISSLQNIIDHTTTDYESIVGRSGGGLYSRSGFVVGVLSASRDGISYYMNLEKIRNMLDKNGLSGLYK